MVERELASAHISFFKGIWRGNNIHISGHIPFDCSIPDYETGKKTSFTYMIETFDTYGNRTIIPELRVRFNTYQAAGKLTLNSTRALIRTGINLG